MSPEVKYVDDDFNVVEQGRILRARIVYCGVKIVIHVTDQAWGGGPLFSNRGVGGFWGVQFYPPNRGFAGKL